MSRTDSTANVSTVINPVVNNAVATACLAVLNQTVAETVFVHYFALINAS